MKTYKRAVNERAKRRDQAKRKVPEETFIGCTPYTTIRNPHNRVDEAMDTTAPAEATSTTATYTATHTATHNAAYTTSTATTSADTSADIDIIDLCSPTSTNTTESGNETVDNGCGSPFILPLHPFILYAVLYKTVAGNPVELTQQQWLAHKLMGNYRATAPPLNVPPPIQFPSPNALTGYFANKLTPVMFK